MDELKNITPALVTLDNLWLPELEEKNVSADALRLDKIHPMVSGNKWFKLKYYLGEALENNHRAIVTFGGAWSNHIVASAFAAHAAGLGSIGFIRGERPQLLSPTLLAAEQYGMNLQFTHRETYKAMQRPEYKPEIQQQYPGALIIPEGGSGFNGLKGSAEILSLTDASSYSHILCAIGTGTMYCGLANSSPLGQKIIGVPVLKGMDNILDQYKQWINDPAKLQDCIILPGYHFGGYAKKTAALIQFMNTLYLQTSVPTDFVYTGKLFYAMMDLLKKGYFKPADRLLIIHSGGLQGNASLGRGELVF